LRGKEAVGHEIEMEVEVEITEVRPSRVVWWRLIESLVPSQTAVGHSSGS
jgi:hypothetical protein